MIKFFTRPPGLLLAWLWSALAFGEMTAPTAPLPVTEAPAASPVATPAGGIPQALPSSRFAALAKKSPFTLASTSEENADFAKDLVLAGYFRTDGQDFVLLGNRTQPMRLMVGTQPSPAAQGLVLVKVERDPSGDPTKLRAQIRKGSETAMLKYETPAAPAGQPATGQGATGQGATGQGATGQPQVPGQVQPPGQAAPGQKLVPNPSVIRRRPPIPTLPR